MDAFLDSVLTWLKSVSVPARMDADTYRAGLALLEDSFRKNFVPRLARPPYNPRKCRLLWIQLRYVASKACAAVPSSATVPAPAAVAKTATKEGKPRYFATPWSEIKVSRLDWELLPDMLKAAWFRKGKLFNEAAASHRKLALANFGKDPRDLSASDLSENARLAASVLGNFEEINHIWKQIDYYVENKRLMPEETKKAPEAIDTIEKANRKLHVRRSNLHTYRSRLAKVEDPEQRKRLYQKLASLEQEIEDLVALKKQLKRNGNKQ